MLVHTFCRILFGDTGLIISIFWRVVEQVPHTLSEYHGDVWEPGAGLEPANLPITNRLLYQSRRSAAEVGSTTHAAWRRG